MAYVLAPSVAVVLLRLGRSLRARSRTRPGITFSRSKGGVLNKLLGNRIAVIGTCGSGKSTLAQQMASICQLPYIELDGLLFTQNWGTISVELFQEQVLQIVDRSCWVVDGNYSSVRDLIWKRADTIAWLDYPLGTVLWRVLCRSIRRCWNRETLWAGNRETWGRLFSKESMILYALKTHWYHRNKYQLLLKDPKFASLRVLRILHL